MFSALETSLKKLTVDIVWFTSAVLSHIPSSWLIHSDFCLKLPPNLFWSGLFTLGSFCIHLCLACSLLTCLCKVLVKIASCPLTLLLFPPDIWAYLILLNLFHFVCYSITHHFHGCFMFLRCLGLKVCACLYFQPAQPCCWVKKNHSTVKVSLFSTIRM